MLGLLMPLAHADEPYRFDRLWPKLAQPWYFSPSDVAIDSDGLVYVADSGFNRIQVFSAEGDFIRSWGRGGTKNGEFSSPGAIAISASGLVYVADTENHRIQVFSTEGQFIRKWGTEGSVNGKFYSPGGIAVSTSGLVYVADTFNSRIQIFEANVVFRSKWGSLGSRDGEFYIPKGIAISPSGEVYVADSFNSRIQVFSTEGKFNHKWDHQSWEPQESSPQKISIGTNGLVYVIVENNPFDTSIIDLIYVFNTEGKFIRSWGDSGYGNGSFSDPTGIVISNSGLVYVADRVDDRIQVFNAEDELIQSWESGGFKNGQFDLPNEVDVSTDGLVYVLDSVNAIDDDTISSEIQVYNAEGEFQHRWNIDLLDTNPRGQFPSLIRPTGIAVNGGFVYVTLSDVSYAKIMVYDTTGQFKRSWGSYGTGEGEFDYPRGIAVSASGDVYVADSLNDRIQVFSVEGEFRGSWGNR
jgi:DNA-binding beta-propeller fold protein YncE